MNIHGIEVPTELLVELTDETFLRLEKALQAYLGSAGTQEAREHLMRHYKLEFCTSMVHGTVTVKLRNGMTVEEFDVMCAELLMMEK